MYSMSADTNLATQIAKQRVDERIRDAEARRTAREVRRAARSHRTANSDHQRRNLFGSLWNRMSRWAPAPGR
jgi:hypothetical protein